MTLFDLLMETSGWVHIYYTPTSTEATLCFNSEAGNESYIKSWITESVLNMKIHRVEDNYHEECLDVYTEEIY